MTISHTAGAQPRRARFSTSRAAFSGTSLLAIASVLAAAPAAQAQTATQSGSFVPAVHDTVDARGIDLITGAYHPPQQSVSIGIAGQGGMSQAYFGSGLRDNLTGAFSYAGNKATVSIGDATETFTDGNSDQGAGSSFGCDAANQVCTYFGADGTKATFAVSNGTPPYQVVTGRILELRKPGGETWTYHYRLFRTPTDSFVFDRIQSVTSNFGYQIKYEYDDVSGNPLFIRAVRAVNNAVRYCDPEADSCGDLSAWPALTFTGGGPGTATVTDSLGHTTTTEHPSASVVKTTYPGDRDITLTTTTNTATTTDLTLALPQGSYHYVFTRDNAGAQQPVTTEVTDPAGRKIKVVARRDFGVITKYTDENNLSTDYAYDSDNGRLTSVTRPEGDATEYDYDDRGNVTATRRNPKPGTGTEPTLTTSAVYPETCTNLVTCNQPSSTTDERGKVTSYTYDAVHGGVLSITRPETLFSGTPDLSPVYVQPVTHFAYEQTNAQARTAYGQFSTLPGVYRLHDRYACKGADACTTSQQSYTSTGYSGKNALPTISVIYRGDGQEESKTEFGYNDIGDLVSQDGPIAGVADTTTYVYDADHPAGRRLVGVQDPDPDGAGVGDYPRARRMSYAPDGQVNKVEQGVVTDDVWSSFSPISYAETAYDGAGRKAFDRVGDSGLSAAASVTQYGYDLSGRLECVKVRMNPATFSDQQTTACALGTEGSAGPDRITRFGYDDGGRLLVTTQGFGTDKARELRRITAYGNDGEALGEQDGKGNVTTYGYDRLIRMRRIGYPAPALAACTPSSSLDHLYDYDAAGQVTGERLRDCDTKAKGYDDAGQLISLDVSNTDLAHRFTHDSFGRLVDAKVTGGALHNEYDSRGNLLSQAGPLGTVSYTYDAADRRTRLTWPDGFYVTYEYDDAGRLVRMKENGGLVLAAFAYDGHDSRAGISRPNGVNTTYDYGPAGRLKTITHSPPTNGVTFGYERNASGQIGTRTTSNPAYAVQPSAPATAYGVNALNQYTTVGGTTLEHNERGDTTFDGQASYGYDKLDRLTSAQGNALSYDALGRLASVGATRFLYDGDDLIAEVNASNVVTKRYVHGPGVDEPLVAYDGAGTSSKQWLLADERGTVVGAAAGSGATTSTALDDYGRGVPLGRFGFTGQTWLGEAGVYHFKARAYSPTLGRFVQSDPVVDPSSPSSYSYVRNDPLNRSDPSGLTDPVVSELTVNALVRRVENAVRYGAANFQNQVSTAGDRIFGPKEEASAKDTPPVSQACAAARRQLGQLGRQLSSIGEGATWTGIGIGVLASASGLFVPEAAPAELYGGAEAIALLEIGGVASTMGSGLRGYEVGGARGAVAHAAVSAVVDQATGIVGSRAFKLVPQSQRETLSALLGQVVTTAKQEESACNAR